MKKLTRKITSFFAGVFAVVSLTLGVATVLTNETVAKAATSSTVDSSVRVQMREGASVRIGDKPETGDQAIRFQTYVQKSYYDGIVNPEAGVYVIPKDLLTTGELTNETPNAKQIVSQVYADETDTYYIYNTVLYDIPENSYGREIIARAYIKNGSTYVWAENPQIRSLSYVASAALENGKDKDGNAYDNTAITYLKNYVDKAISTFSIEQDSFTLTAGEKYTVAPKITPKYAQDDLSDLVVKYSSDNEKTVIVEDGQLVAKSAGIATVTATLGSSTDSFTVVVKGKNQDLLMTDTTIGLDLSLPTGYSVTSITCLGENWGTNPSALTVSDSLKTNTASHGETTVEVNVSNGKQNYTLTIPVTLVTETISTASDFSKVQIQSLDSAIYGYYILTNDITSSTAIATPQRLQDTKDGDYGFRGTFDGRGYTVTTPAGNGGIFGGLGRNALIKDVTFTCTSINIAGYMSLIASGAIGATMQGVTFNFNSITNSNTGTKGLIFEQSSRDCHFIDVVINITGKANNLFGHYVDNWLGFNANQQNYWGTLCTFTNCTVNLMTADSSLAMIGEGYLATGAYQSGTVKQFIVAGCTTTAGDTTVTVEGITLQTPRQISVNLENQDLFMTNATHSLNLGVYANYEVQSIAFNGENVGKDPTAITLPSSIQTDKTQHGTGKSFTVVVKSATEIITLTIPVTLVTDTISKAEDFSKVQIQSLTSAIYGYYILTDDITSSKAIATPQRLQPTDDGVYGFRGTFDGRGYTVTTPAGNGGIFGGLGRNALIKDVTFTCTSIDIAGYMGLIAAGAIGATMQDVTFNFNSITNSDTGTKGLIFEQGSRDCHFIDVVINITGKANNLFGHHVSNWLGFNANQQNYWDTLCTFTNCTVNLMTADSSLAMIGEGYLATGAGKSGTVKQFIVDGCTTTAGNTTVKVEGITLSTIEVKSATLDYTQDLYLTAKLQMLDLGAYADYEISSITSGSYNFGTNPAKLTVSDAFKTDKASHGEQNIIVTAQKGTDLVELTVPVIFVTDTIETMDDLLALQPTDSNSTVYGYYILTADIGSLDTELVRSESDPTDVTKVNEKGFRGAIDGRGHTVSLTLQGNGVNHQHGLFDKLNGAILRNVTFDCANMYLLWGNAILGRRIENTKFENVTFNFRSVSVNEATTFGVFGSMYGISGCNFSNVHVILNADRGVSLFGADNGVQFKGNNFNDCQVSLLNGSTLLEIGHDSNTTYIVDGCTTTATATTKITGITLTSVEERAETLSYTQDVVVSAKNPFLNLGKYSKYEITSIKYGDYDLGTDISALTIPEALKEDTQNHGEGKTIIVKAKKLADMVKITVPVTLVTEEISTAADFSKVQIQSTTSAIYGYYILTDDITSSTAIATPQRLQPTDDGVYGFRGTFDGRGYTVTTPAGNGGIFGGLGRNALIKDVTFTCTSIDIAGYMSLIASGAIGATMQDVTFNFNGITNSNTGTKGLIIEQGSRDCHFIDVVINITGKANNLFGHHVSNWLGFNANQQNFPNTLCTFTECTINLLTSDSSLEMLGAGYNGKATIVYQPTGVVAADGEETVTGITLRDNTAGTYLLRGNTSPYTIVVPSSTSTELNYASEELIRFFKEATGVTLGVIEDTGLSHEAEQTYISLGATNLYTTARFNVPTLKRDGAYVKTQDKNIYIVGGSDEGVLNGVYEFLGNVFGYEQYYKDCYTLNTDLKEIELDNYDITSNPDIDYRGMGGIFYTFGNKDGYVVTEDDTMYSYRLGSTDAYWKHSMPVVHAADNTKAAADHNSLYYFPVEMYQTSHPEFYSTESTFDSNSWGGINAQLCYTARGNSAGTYDLMTTLAAERIQASLIKYAGNTQYTAVQIGIEDCYQMCTCAGCNAVVNQYGAISATIIIFLNDVAVKVNAWMERNPAYARDLQYMFFAYHQTQKAPTTFPTVSNGVKIAPFVALSNMDHDLAIDDTTTRDITALGKISNNMLYGWLKSWGNFAQQNGGKAWAWTYGSFFYDYFVFFDSYNFYSKFFAALTECGYEMTVVQQHSAQRGTDTAFFSMNAYLLTKLAWDSSLDINTLIDNYMAAMYEDAAGAMKSLFEKWKSIYANRLSGLVNSYADPASKLKKADIDELFKILDTAYAAIAKYETSDPAKYAKLKAHIDMEWLAPAKIACVDLKKSYNSSFNWGDYKYKDIAPRFETLCNQFGIVALSEFETINATIESL